MIQSTKELMPVATENESRQETFRQHLLDWVRMELVWYAGSFSFHLVALSVLLLLPNYGSGPDQSGMTELVSRAAEEEPTRDNTLEKIPPTDLSKLIDIDDRDKELIVDPRTQTLGLLTLDATATAQDVPPPGSDCRSKTTGGSKDGSLGAMNFGDGAKTGGSGGVITGPCNERYPHDGGGGGFGPRGPSATSLTTPPTQRAVNAALVWLANHQEYDGHWSLQRFTDRCSDRTCTGKGEVLADAGATALGVLPFLGVGQTHKSKGTYREHVRKAIAWLMRQQQPDGNLAKGAEQMMYSHGLATIALCEAYGLTGDREIGRAAQGAVNFILNAQNANDGGWRYNPKDPGDTSVFGWQLMALKSAHMAGLDVGGSAFADSSKWLDSVALHDGTEYAYQPGQGPSNTMTSVGLLCRQYLGAKRHSPLLSGGTAYLMNHLPDEAFPNVYYWYYATQVMHNMQDSDWDVWNRKIRKLLVHTQVRDKDVLRQRQLGG